MEFKIFIAKKNDTLIKFKFIKRDCFLLELN